MSKRDLLAYLFFAILNVATALVLLTDTTSGNQAAWDGVPLDDTWIHFVYARNLAEHGGFYYNPGVPEAGFTSPLWIILLAIPLKLVLPLVIGPVPVSKALSVGFAILASALAYYLVRSYTDSHLAGLLAGTLVALDPTFSFSKVSGMEVTLFASLMLLTILLFTQERFLAVGVALGLTILARPEGYLLAGVMAVAVLLWLSLELGQETAPPLGAMVRLLVPAALIVLPTALFYYSVNGSPFPNTFHAKRQPLSLINVVSLRGAWFGYLRWLTYFSGIALWITVPLLLLGMWFCLQKRGLLALPLTVTPWALCYGLSLVLPCVEGRWTFFGRRCLDPVIPFFALLLSVGLWRLGQLFKEGFAHRVMRWPSALSLVKVVVPLFVLVVLALVVREATVMWQLLPGEYSWNCRNINDMNVEMGRWIDESLPPDARVATTDAGAIRYFGHRETLDFLGLNWHEALERNPFEIASERKDIDYIVTFPGPVIDGWPYAGRMYEITIINNTIAGLDTMAVYETDWSPQFTDKDTWYGIATEGWELIDSLDVGNAADEVGHDYEVSKAKNLAQREFKTAAEAVISDEGQVYTGRESFTVMSRPGVDLVIAKRYDAVVRGTVRVYANGALVGEWSFAERLHQFGEDTFVVPGHFISREQTRLTFEFVPGNSIDINSFYYWIFVSRS